MARGRIIGSVYLPLFFFLHLTAAVADRGMVLLGGKRRDGSSFDSVMGNATWSLTSPALNVFGLVHGKIGIRNEIAAFDSVVELEKRNPREARARWAGRRKASGDDDTIGNLFRRQGSCPTGFSPCTDNRNVCCPTGGSCCTDGSCCASGFSCVFQTSPAKIVCCPSGSNCPGTSPCEDAGYVICLGQNFCCPLNWTCFRDTLGAGKCTPPPTSTISSGSSTTPSQTVTNSPTISTPSPTLSPSNSTTPTLSPTPTSPTVPANTPTAPTTTPNPATSNTGGVSVVTTLTTVGVGAPTAESQNLTSNSTPVGAIAGGVVGGVALIALIIVAIFIFIKRRRANEEYEDSRVPSPTLPSDFAPQMAQFQQEQAQYAASGAGGGAGYAPSVAGSGNTAGVAGYGSGGYNPGGFAAAAGAAGVGAYAARSQPHYQKANRGSYPNPNQAAYRGGYGEGAYGGMQPSTSPDPGPDPFHTSPPGSGPQPLPNPGVYYSNAPHSGSYGALPSDQRYSGVSQDQRYSGQRYSAQGQAAGYIPPHSASTQEQSRYSHYYGPSTGNTASFYGGDSPNATTPTNPQFGQAR